MGIDRYAGEVIRIKAHQLIGRYGFTESDRPDIEQQLALCLLEALPHYDPDKATRRTFICRIVDRAVADLARRRTAEKRAFTHRHVSLDGRASDGGEGQSEAPLVLTEDATGDLRDLALDLADALETLPEKLRRLCEQLPDTPIAEIARREQVSRKTVYTWLKKLRRRFEQESLDDYV